MGKSSVLFSRLTDIQDEVANVLFRELKYKEKNACLFAKTNNGVYTIALGRRGVGNGKLNITNEETQKVFNEYTIETGELIEILAYFEENT